MGASDNGNTPGGNFVDRVRAMAHWEPGDDVQALRTRLACIGAAAIDELHQLPKISPDQTLLVVPTAELKAFVEMLSHEYMGKHTAFFNQLAGAVKDAATE